MIRNIKILCEREFNILTRKRIFIFAYSIIGVIFSIVILISINKIISMATHDGLFKYENVEFLHNRLVDLFFILSIFSSVFFLSNSINQDINNNAISNIMSSGIAINEIVISKFIVGFISILSIDIFVIPIIILSLFYGGTSIPRFILFVIFAISISMFSSSLFLLFSFIFKDNIKSILFGIIIGIIFSALCIIFREYVILNSNIYILAIVLNIILTILILFATSKMHIPE